MMQSNELNRDTAAPAIQGLAQSELSKAAMPSINRSNVFSRAASVIAMSLALFTGEARAQMPSYLPPSPTPATEPAVPKAIPIATPVVAPVEAPARADKYNITRLENRQFCMDDDGNVLIPRRTQVRKVGQEVQGLPSNGEAFRAICEGVASLKSAHGGQIPAGQDVKLRIAVQGPETVRLTSWTLNPATLSSIADLCPAALNTAMADPMNNKAIEAIRREVDLHVVRSGTDTLTMTFIGKERGQAVFLSVELAPRQ
jgi:hypothetical protein